VSVKSALDKMWWFGAAVLGFLAMMLASLFLLACCIVMVAGVKNALEMLS
jgi:hypothetical protein